jgi:hypothetical protein
MRRARTMSARLPPHKGFHRPSSPPTCASPNGSWPNPTAESPMSTSARPERRSAARSAGRKPAADASSARLLEGLHASKYQYRQLFRRLTAGPGSRVRMNPMWLALSVPWVLSDTCQQPAGAYPPRIDAPSCSR